MIDDDDDDDEVGQLTVLIDVLRAQNDVGKPSSFALILS